MPKKKKITKGQTSLFSPGVSIPSLYYERDKMWENVLGLKEQYYRFIITRNTLASVIGTSRDEIDVDLLAVAIQRYGDQRLHFLRHWWLTFLEGYNSDDPYRQAIQGEALAIFDNAPRVEDYEWSSYWVNPDDREGIRQFIKDRAKWAIPHCRKNLLEEYHAFRFMKQRIRDISKKLRANKILLFTKEFYEEQKKPNYSKWW